MKWTTEKRGRNPGRNLEYYISIHCSEETDFISFIDIGNKRKIPEELLELPVPEYVFQKSYLKKKPKDIYNINLSI